MSHTGRPTTERRIDGHLAFDRVTGRLRLGAAAIPLPPAAGNRAALKAYVDLVRHVRGERPAALAEIRESDLDALAIVLDLDAEDLPDRIEAVLGRTPAETTDLMARLDHHRMMVTAASGPAPA